MIIHTHRASTQSEFWSMCSIEFDGYLYEVEFDPPILLQANQSADLMVLDDEICVFVDDVKVWSGLVSDFSNPS